MEKRYDLLHYMDTKSLGVAQVELNSISGSVSTAGNATVIVTASGMTGSPKTVTVALAQNDSASAVAEKIRVALRADANVGAFFTVGGSGANVSLTAKAKVANDATMNLSIAKGTADGITSSTSSVDLVAGVAVGANSVYSLVNQGFTSFDDDLAPKTETKQYIADQNEREEVVGYKPSYKYGFELDHTDPVCAKLYAIGAKQLVEQTVDIVTVESWTLANGVCIARKGTYNVIPSKAGSGDAGGSLMVEGTLVQLGSLTDGHWDVASSTFS
jgi:hypothetical protein